LNQVNLLDNAIDSKNEISFVGRFEIKQKRQDIMLKAFHLVQKEIKDIKLVFYGDGEDVNVIKTMVNNLKLNDKIVFRGKVDNVESHIYNSKLFVLTSDYEGIPNSLIEAMSLGLPCISTDCDPGGARLLIKDNINGLLVPKGDEKKIAEAILFLLRNPVSAYKIGQEARKILEEYSEDKIIYLWKTYIEKIIWNIGE